MKILSDKNKLIKILHNEKNLGFVPTMGSLHEGHISLIKKSIKECKKTIVSIYVNKPQFNRKKDFKSYPKNLKRDLAILYKYKVNYLYLPISKQIYPDGVNKKIKISAFKKKLCGKFRPGHFEAIADIIDRFIKIINPKKIYMGEKDMQQLKIIENFVNKNYKKIKIVPCKTIREKNGIACSSRNILLNSKQINIASKIYCLIKKNKKNLIKNKRLVAILKNEIKMLGAYKIDYLEILNINNLIKPFKKNKVIRIFIAYYIGSTRLIDNI